MSKLLDISLAATLLPARSKRATNNAPAKLIAQFEIDVDAISDEDAGALARYVGQSVDLSVIAVAPLLRKADPRPMDIALAQVQEAAEERMRPLPDAICAKCGTAIGDDAEACFDAPTAGPPYPLHGTCYELWRDDREIVEQRAREDRVAFLSALDSTQRTSELRVALLDAYDSGDPERGSVARVLVGIEEGPDRLPDDPEEYQRYLEWLRHGDPDEESDEADPVSDPPIEDSDEADGENEPDDEESEDADQADMASPSDDEEVARVTYGADGKSRMERRRAPAGVR